VTVGEIQYCALMAEATVSPNSRSKSPSPGMGRVRGGKSVTNNSHRRSEE
jgi:hypothetical protein